MAGGYLLLSLFFTNKFDQEPHFPRYTKTTQLIFVKK